MFTCNEERLIEIGNKTEWDEVFQIQNLQVQICISCTRQ
jgi:sulfur relay (sulfurtransferase) complex TusBCD TusD component (DsrE family)